MLGNLRESAFRWFCFLNIDDKVFDHSTISYFIERVGNEGFGEIFQFNEELQAGVVSRQMYADSSLVRANVSGRNLSRSGMSVEEFKEKAVEENGLFVLRERQVDKDGVISERVRHFQNSKGRMPLNKVDTDARWSTNKRNKRPTCTTRRTSLLRVAGSFLRAGHARQRGRLEAGN